MAPPRARFSLHKRRITLGDMCWRVAFTFRENEKKLNLASMQGNGLRTRSTPRGPVTPRPHGTCFPGRTRHFWDYLLILVGQLGCLRRFQASEHSLELIWSVVARLGSSNVKILGRVAPITKDIFGTSEVKNESSEALLMSHVKRTCCLDTKISTSKVDYFSMEKFQIPPLPPLS